MKIAGLDIGTTGCKLSIFDEAGTYLDKAYRTYPVTRADIHEIDAAMIWNMVLEVIREMASKYQDIAGIGVTSFGETFVLTDEKGKVLHKAILYTDPRGREECEQLTEHIGKQKLVAITGLNPHEMYSISKLMWIKKHWAGVYQMAKHVFLMEDYIVFQLTGKAQIDYSLASRTMAFDISKLEWSEEIFSTAGVDMSLMSATVPSGTAAGKINPEIAEITGLSANAVVVCCGHDQLAAAVGAGVFHDQLAAEGAGTVECITPIYDEMPDLQIMARGNYAVVPYVFPGKYIAYAFSYTGGALIQWCMDTLAKKEKDIAQEKGVSAYKMLEGESASPTGLLVLPHFAGAATPYMDTGSKGAIIGLTTATTVKEIYRACMEGVAYEMKLNLEYLKDAGRDLTKMYATGGGAESEEWMQMKADIVNIPITVLKVTDAGTVGCAMMTGVAVGCFADLKDAATYMVQEGATFVPRAEKHDAYLKIYRRYRQVYDAIRFLV